MDWETFLTTLYVMVDDFCHTLEPERHPGPYAGLSRSEVLTLALFARLRRFSGERDFYRFAEEHLRGAFPKLPTRSWYNRQVRAVRPLLEQLAVWVASQLGGSQGSFEAIDRAPAPTRNVKRRGRVWRLDSVPASSPRQCYSLKSGHRSRSWTFPPSTPCSRKPTVSYGWSRPPPARAVAALSLPLSIRPPSYPICRASASESLGSITRGS